MNEFLDFFKSQAIDFPFVVFMMLFSCGIALFHSLIILSLYNLELRPKWMFYALNPAIILVAYYIQSGYALLALILLFASVFIMAIIGGIRSAIKGDPETKRYNSLKPKKPLWKRIVIGVAVTVFCIVFISSGPYAFVIIFAIAFFTGIMPSSTNRFKKYQATLPTSKIRSLAMGLVEVEGTVRTDKPILARIDHIECIGYKYVVEDISTDKDGHDSYSEIFSETICSPFYITDETGTIEVNPDKLEFIWMDLDGRHSTGMKRYSQYLLKQNDHVLIIGKASVKGNIPVLEHENIKNVFGVAPLSKVTEYNTYKPLLNSFIFFSSVMAVLVAVVLISPVSVNDGLVTIHLSSQMFTWNGLFNF